MKFVSNSKIKVQEQQLINLLIADLILKIIKSEKVSNVNEEVSLLQWLLKREIYK